MPKIQYEEKKFKPARLAQIEQANTIVAEYTAQGLNLTLRQLFYQFVSRSLIANTNKEYKKLGDTVSDGRMAGLIDWSAIHDRTRFLRKNPTWASPEAIIAACAEQFRIDKWQDQRYYIECLIEKDALIGVIEDVCSEHEVPYLACRGYASMSELWNTSNRFNARKKMGKKCVILYLGDHDPSGIDMTRDVQSRLDTFIGVNAVEVIRLALNMDQIEQYQPPPNPTKLTDSRSTSYVAAHGDESWELDALDPTVIVALIRTAILERRVQSTWDAAVAEEDEHKANLQRVAEAWDDVTQWLNPPV